MGASGGPNTVHDGLVFSVDAADKVTFVASNAVVGERVDIFCDGTNYYCTMFGVADNAMASSG